MAEYIDREALICNIEKEIEQQRKMRNVFATVAFAHIKGVVDNFPTADVVEVRHGYWKTCFEDWRKQFEGDECSVCGFQSYGFGISHYLYCPNCGAKMDGKGEGE